MGQHKHKRDAGMFQQLSHSKTAAGTYVGVLHIHFSPVVVRTYRSPNLSVVFSVAGPAWLILLVCDGRVELRGVVVECVRSECVWLILYQAVTLSI